MSKRTQARTTLKQKLDWEASKKLGSRFTRVIPPEDYASYRQNDGHQFDASGRRTK